MDIIKLSSKQTEMTFPRRASSRPSSRGSSLNPLPSSRTVSDNIISSLFITDLKQGIKNPNRVNVYVNEKFAFSLDVTQVVDYKVETGLELTSEKFEELKKASEYGKMYQRTLEWVLVRPRSVRETKDYLARKFRKSSSDALVPARRYGRDFARPLLVSRGWSSEDISELSDEVIFRLLNKGYLDDHKFAEFYVENRFVKKGVSQKRLKMELMKKGVAREIIDEVLAGRDDTEEVLKMIKKKRAKYDDEKLVQYLCRQGFQYDLVKEIVENYSSGSASA